MEATVIVLDGHLKSALATVRSLGRAGITVHVGACRRSAMAQHSRFCRSRFSYPDPKTDQTAFLTVLKTEVDRIYAQTTTAPVLYCFSDATHVSVAQALDQFAGKLRFPLPNVESFAIAFDKQRTAELARSLGVTTIPTHPLAEAERLTYPAVVKPSTSVSWQDNQGHSGTAQFVFSAAELKAVTETTPAPLIQSYIQGTEYGVELMCDEGEVLAHFVHERIRSLSPTGGASVVKRTAPVTALTDTMRGQAMGLARSLQWTGPMMVEWRVEDATQTVYLTEINGRFWGSLPLAIRAGVDFPLMYYHLAHGEHITHPRSVMPKVARTRHFWGDVKWLLGVLFDRTPLRATVYPKRFSALLTFMIEPFRSTGDVWASDDVLPALAEIVAILKR